MAGTAFPRWLLHVLLALPLIVVLVRWGLFIADGNSRAAGLGAEPVEHTINFLGLWALRCLLLTLAVTPLRKLTRINRLAAWRRPLGLWAFAYAALHLAVYFGLDLLGSLALLWDDIVKRNFILLGMTAWLLLLPLAITSTHGWIRRMGAPAWQRLHRLVYAAAAAASVHFILRVKGSQWEPWVYAALLAMLLLARPVITHWHRSRRGRS
jgi:sulfoxide reductase heme-binding subunit YedZ